MASPSDPRIIKTIEDFVFAIEINFGITLPYFGLSPAEKFTVETVLIGIFNQYGKFPYKENASGPSPSNDSSPLSDTVPATQECIPTESPTAESQSPPINLVTSHTSTVSDSDTLKSAESSSKIATAIPDSSVSSEPPTPSSISSNDTPTASRGAADSRHTADHRDAAANYDPNLNNGGDTEDEDDGFDQEQYESDLEASDRSQPYLPASSPPPNENKREYAIYASNDSTEEPQFSNSPQAHKRTRTQNGQRAL